MAGVKLYVFTPSRLTVDCPKEKLESSPPLRPLSPVGTSALAHSARAYLIFGPPVFHSLFLNYNKSLIVRRLFYSFIFFLISIFYEPFNGHERELHILQISKFWALPSNSLMSYFGVLLLCRDAFGVFHSPSWMGSVTPGNKINLNVLNTYLV